MAFFLGIILNELINMMLKCFFKVSRPCRPGDASLLYSKHAMPSSHAQFMGFFAVYMLFFAYSRLKMHNSENFMDNLRKHLIGCSSFGAALLVCFSRVYLYYHTVDQVCAGMAVGGVGGALWFYVVDSLFTPLFAEIVNTKLAEYFLIRDSSEIPDILWFEYIACRAEGWQRQKRVASKSQ